MDPVFAIVFGVIAANIANAAQLESLELDSVISTPILDRTFDPGTSDEFSARIGLLAFRGSFTVSSSRKLVELLGADIRDHEVVIFDLSGTTHADDSAAYLLAQIIDRAGQTDTEIVVCGINDRIRDPLFAFDVLDRIPEDRIVESERKPGTSPGHFCSGSDSRTGRRAIAARTYRGTGRQIAATLAPDRFSGIPLAGGAAVRGAIAPAATARHGQLDSECGYADPPKAGRSRQRGQRGAIFGHDAPRQRRHADGI